MFATEVGLDADCAVEGGRAIEGDFPDVSELRHRGQGMPLNSFPEFDDHCHRTPMPESTY